MRWNPILNAIGAALYIAAVALFMHAIQRPDTPDTIFDSMAALSLIVFSAAVMAFLFFYRPLVLLIEGNKREALSYFRQTLGSFGIITLIAIATMLALR